MNLSFGSCYKFKHCEFSHPSQIQLSVIACKDIKSNTVIDKNSLRTQHRITYSFVQKLQILFYATEAKRLLIEVPAIQYESSTLTF